MNVDGLRPIGTEKPEAVGTIMQDSWHTERHTVQVSCRRHTADFEQVVIVLGLRENREVLGFADYFICKPAAAGF